MNMKMNFLSDMLSEKIYHVRIQKVLSEGVQHDFFFLVDQGREDQNITKSGPLLAGLPNAILWQADDGPTLKIVSEYDQEIPQS